MNCGKSNETIYYTYYAYENNLGIDGKGYIGFRKCPEGITPEKDNYFGTPSSSKNQYFKIKSNKSKIILGVFDNHKDALAHEIYLHELWKVDINPHFANEARQKSNGFYCEIAWNKGQLTLPEVIEKLKISHLKENLNSEARQNMSDGRKGVKPWNNGLKGSQIPWNKDLKGIGKKHSWINKNLNLIELDMTIREMTDKYSTLDSVALHRVTSKERNHHKGWKIYSCFYDDPQPSQE